MLPEKINRLVNSRLVWKYLQHRTIVSQAETNRMEKSINNVTILGRAGAEPQKRGTEEHPVVLFSVATHTNYRYDSGEFMQRTEWHRVSVFKPNLRETVMNYLKKGQRVHVTGRLSYGEMKTDDGSMRPTATIVADDVIFFQPNDSSTK